MQFILGILFLLFLVRALGMWFFVLVGLAVGALAVCGCLAESGVSDEERAERRRRREELRHEARLSAQRQREYERQLEIQAEYVKKQQRSALLGGLGGTAAKVGVSLALQALTGGAHRHRH